MRNIKMTDDEYIKNLWAYVFINCYTCEQFDEMEESYNFSHCLICEASRNDEGEIVHKDRVLVVN